MQSLAIQPPAGISHRLLRAARAAAPALAHLRASAPSSVLRHLSSEPPPSPTAVAWLYLAAAERPYGLLKQLCAQHGTDYDSTRAAIQHLRQHHCVL